jgi:hypothetical protein
MPTANLQAPQMTVKQAAKLFKISERLIYMSRRLLLMGRPDLVAKVKAGEMSINAALREAEERAKPTSWDRLVTAWNNATDDDRGRLAMILMGQAEVTA